MVTAVFRFPGGRYHATPTGHHVNEGWIEWPPSPWRLLRALIATGYTKLRWDAVPDTAAELIRALAGSPPKYILPPACTGHSRHYMPLAKFKNGREDTTLVFDTWAQVADGDLAVTWNVSLPSDQLALLAELVGSMSYLGRAESWVEGHLEQDDWVPRTDALRAFPCEGAARPGPNWEQVSLLAAEPADDYDRWRSERVGPVEAAAKASKSKKKPPRKSKATTVEYPEDILACLQVDTAWLDAYGWNQPPGSRKVLYWRPRQALEPGAPLLASPDISIHVVEAMLLALATPSGNMHALPPVTRALPQAELLHRSLVSHVARLYPDHHAVLTGQSDTGAPLSGHRHVHLLPLDLDGDAHLDHILVWAPMGLDSAAQAAVRAVRKTYMKGGVGELRVALSAAGSLKDLRSTPGPGGDALRRTLSLSSVWQSATPFVPPRHVKNGGRNTLVGQVQAELASRGLPAASHVEVLAPDVDGVRALRHFVRVRRFGPPPPADLGFAVRVVFDAQIVGPLCLGYGSHFGLGRFTAEPDGLDG